MRGKLAVDSSSPSPERKFYTACCAFSEPRSFFSYEDHEAALCPISCAWRSWNTLWYQHKGLMKKALRDTQTLRRSQKKFRPAADPFPGAQEGQNLISWRQWLPSPTDPVWWKSMHAISSYRGNRHRPPFARPPQTGPITIHCAAMIGAQCNDVHAAGKGQIRQMWIGTIKINHRVIAVRFVTR